VSTDLFGRYLSLLKADGTNRLQRTLPALERGYVLPDERALPDLLDYAGRLAEEIRFYNLSGQATGDWRAFLEPLADPDSAPPRTLPHLALFLAFLHLFGHLQDDLNELPERHLRHYVEQFLGLRRREPAGDAVHVIFELARNAAPAPLPAGTPLDAGKDAAGRPLTYATRNDLVVTAARVAQKRRLVAEADRRGARRFFVADEVAELEGASWHTFGSGQLALDPARRFMREAEIGFAVASPLLRLAEGERRLTLRATLRAVGRALPPPQGIAYGLVPTLTGAEGWLAPDSFEARLAGEGLVPTTEATVLEIQLTLGAGAPAVVPFDPALHGNGPASGEPVLRCLLRGDTGLYETLAGLILEDVELAVEVNGVHSLVLHNDQGPLTPGQPVPLFGSQPRLGSRFYVGSAEVFSKRLSSLTVNLKWQDVPPDLLAHYRAYFDSLDDLDDFAGRFLVDVHFLYHGSWDYRILNNESLFGFPNLDSRSMTAGPGAFAAAFGSRPYAPRPELDEITRFDADSKDGFVRLTLTNPSYGPPQAVTVPFKAFGHQAFPQRYAAQAIALSQHTGPGPKPELPNEPYTPTLTELSLDYTAEASATAGDPHAAETLFVIEPWGFSRAGREVAARLVPDLDPEATRDPDKAPFQGSLFLGVAGLTPPANLSLLFQIERGTATSNEVLRTGETEWSQLSGDRWQSLPPAAVLNDTTRGFQQPGLVVLAVGREASTGHTAMPAGLIWLRALVRRPPESAARTSALHPQAALAELATAFASPEELADHVRNGLPAGTIQRLRRRDPAIRRVSQPYASFGGRAGEQDDELFRRSSERLRHRNRAVTAWDLERLVLEAFPDVFKVKALAHSDADGNPRAGEAALVIVPDLRRADSPNFLQPRAGAVLMGAIEDYVRSGIATPFATLHVVHPVYERVLIDARVAFQPGLDAGFHAALLDRELQRFLSPWAFTEGEDIVFGARIYRSEVLAFIEGRDYVDFVIDFNLYHSFAGLPRGGIGKMVIGHDFVVGPTPRPAVAAMTIGKDFVVGEGVEMAEATRPHAILVSHPAHRITAFDAGEAPCPGTGVLGIGYLTVGLDFEVLHP
jgi:hypothetical protein